MKKKFKPGDTITWEVKTVIKVTTKELKEDLRKRFKGQQLILSLEKNYKKYVKLSKEIILTKERKLKLATGRISRVQQKELRSIAVKLDIVKMEMDLIKAQVDLNLRRLKFVLPELKSIELSDPEGNNPMGGFVSLLRESLQKDA